MNSIITCSLNLGRFYDYFAQYCYRHHPEEQKKEATLKLLYNDENDENNPQKKTANQMLNVRAATYCLQEVMNERRPIITLLREKNYKVIRLENDKVGKKIVHFDTAVILDQNVFKDIENHSCNVSIPISNGSFFTNDVAIAKATHISTGEKIVYLSAHVRGFDITLKENQRNEEENEKINIGNMFCETILEKISRIGKDALIILCLDMNVSPEILPSRFEMFSRYGFGLYRTGKATNVCPNEPSLSEREIDFVFVKQQQSIWRILKSFFVTAIQWTPSIKPHTFAWTDDYCSDHLPVFVEISPRTQLAKITQLWNKAYSLISYYFTWKQKGN